MTGIFGETFRRGWAPGALGDRAWLDALVDVETALLRAAGEAGAVPADDVNVIAQAWENLSIDVEVIGGGAAIGGNPVIPLVALLKSVVPEGVRRYVHVGATSQDILDTATMLLSRRAATAIVGHLAAAARGAAVLAADHAGTEMAGRTLMQDALPITFGFKAAHWMSALDGAVGRLSGVAAGLPVQYGGPVGTFAGTGGHGPAIRSNLAVALGLVEPDLDWHSVRLPVADLAGALATASGVVGKVALDVVLLSQTAVHEAAEGTSEDQPPRGGSSSMPHKHNPIAAISARACAMRTPALAATLYAAMAAEHERAAGAWHSEWETLTDLLRLTGSAAAWLAECLRDLTVSEAAMAVSRRAMPGTSGLAEQLTVAALRRRTES